MTRKFQEVLLPGKSSGLNREALGKQTSAKYQQLIQSYESRRKRETGDEAWPRAKTNGYYQTTDGTCLLRGIEFADGIQPVNTQEIKSLPLSQRILIECRIVFGRTSRLLSRVFH